MLSFAFYFLKVIICSAVLFSYYWFFLRNKVFHSYNRFYLLAIVAISLAAPVIKINVWHNTAEGQTGVIKMLQVVNSNDEYMDEIILYSQYNHVSKEKIFMFTYLLVSFILGMIFLRLLFRIRKLLKENTARQIDDVYFIKTHAKGTPFSFLKFIFWNDAIDLETRAGQQIFKHELAHVQEKHSYDKLFINVILIFAWCNPFFWLVRKELNIIHEFIADQKAVEDGNSADFAAMILKATYPQFNFPLANHFFYSPIKRRLMMLTKQNKKQFSYLSRLIVLPVILIVLAAFTIKAKTFTLGTSSLNNAKITVVIDPGHGGTDIGAKALDGSLEKDLCLEYAKKIKALNQNENINIILTRESDIYMNPKEKAAFARNAGADLLISVHMSSANPLSKVVHNGMEIYVAKDQYNNSEASKLFASAIIGSFQDNYNLKVPSNPMQRATGIWILQESQCPAVLIEAGFLSDKNDLAYLKTEKASETFAKNVLNAIEQFQRTNTFSTNQSLPAETRSNNASHVEYANADAQHPVVNKNENQLANEYKQVIASGNANENVNAMQVINLPGAKTIKKEGEVSITTNKIIVQEYNKSGRSPFSKNEFPLIIVDGIEYTGLTMEGIIKKLGTDDFETVTLYNKETAVEKYGAKAKDGAIVIARKKDINQEISITLAGTSKNKIHISELKNIQEIKVNNPDYKVLSGTIFFVGVGFPKVVSTDFNGESVNSLKVLFDKIRVGTRIVFEHVKIAKRDGSDQRIIKEQYFDFYDPKIEVPVYDPGEKIFVKVETEPQFPGGQEEWRKYLTKNLDAGLPVKEGWAAGTYKFIIQFIVDKDGNVSDVTTKDYPNSLTAKHCIEFIQNGPKWIPAKQNNLTVTAYKKQPITFVVSEQ